MLLNVFAVAAVVGVASAQRVIQVIVGMDANGQAGNFFSPNKVTAVVGDTVQFQFMGGNHTVTQSGFDTPCIPISMTNTSVVGFHSGFFPTQNVPAGMVPAWNLQINDTRPIWLYCARERHCQSGMGMVINENTAANQSRSLESYVAAAATVPQAMLPAGGLVAGGVPGDANNPNANGNDPNAQGANPNSGMGLQVPITALFAAAAGAALFL